ncbi:tyrosine-type recombinase/integrase [Alteromonas naphthalenivorans]|uniref:Phage integrase family site-specific recombinase n=1 Tax=Alteromonas naphthalenivorans TaxID=715451 RepID=F5Z5F1_ALTNA|nr:tyrosine-type recombinase/integrase [Alteromonas naphthalenivorans]AEF04877.1 phage integrase family site-specific recombinase [Alteromonas naphthalenivorans]
MDTACPYTLYLGRLAPSSQRSIASQLNSIADQLDWPRQGREAMFCKIDYQQASRIKAMLLSNGWSARSINRAMTAIRNIVKVAVLSGITDEMQALQLQTITKVKHGNHRGTPLSSKQVEKLFVTLSKNHSLIGIRDHAIFALLLGTGLRRSELVTLMYADYSPDFQTLFIRQGKGNKSRTVYLPHWSNDLLMDWVQIRGSICGPLFLRIARGGHIQPDSPLSTSFIYSLIRSTLASHGIEGVSPHDLRRTFITRLLEQNVDLNTVRQMAGHADIATTIIYDKRHEKVMKKAAVNLQYDDRSNEHG